jgi:antitoxin ParD1/3/4
MRFIREKVASGEYDAPDDVITAALDCFQQIEQLRALRLKQLRREIDIGIAQLDRGEGRDADKVFERVRRRIRAEKLGGRMSRCRFSPEAARRS